MSEILPRPDYKFVLGSEALIEQYQSFAAHEHSVAVALYEALEAIAQFGKENSGCGYSCAKKATVALIAVERSGWRKEP